MFGGETLTTNNRMELMAVIEALGSLKRRCRVVLHTDSQYVQLGITRVAAELDTARLENRRPQTGKECGFVAAPADRCRAARHRMALGQGTRRTPTATNAPTNWRTAESNRCLHLPV